MSALVWVCFRPTRFHDWRLDSFRAESPGHARGIVLDRYDRSAALKVEFLWIKPMREPEASSELAQAALELIPGEMSQQLRDKERFG